MDYIIPQVIKDLTKQKGYNYIAFLGKFKNYDVYSIGIVTPNNKVSATGVPEILLVSNEKYKFICGMESFDILDAVQKDEETMNNLDLPSNIEEMVEESSVSVCLEEPEEVKEARKIIKSENVNMPNSMWKMFVLEMIETHPEIAKFILEYFQK